VPEIPPVPVTPPAEVTPPVKEVTPPAEITPISLPVSIPSVSVPSVSVPARALPVTGSGVLLEVLLGLAALVVGGAMTVMGRRRRLAWA
jgi:LPXTG-motif cell wall-anchored protein